MSLRLSGVSHAYGLRRVLEDIDLELAPRRAVALVGPSGCGKTTLLHLCAGLLTLKSGRIDNAFRRPAMMFQQPRLPPWKTAADNIALGLKAMGLCRRERQARVRAVGRIVELDADALSRFPHQLSGGMQSRVALARALVLEPDLLLLDEPFSALDIGLKAQLHDRLLREQARLGLAMLMITHDPTEAVRLADTVLVMNAEPGRIAHRLDQVVPALGRDDAQVHRATALLLGTPGVRACFGLPPLVTRQTPREAAPDASTMPGASVHDASVHDASARGATASGAPVHGGPANEPPLRVVDLAGAPRPKRLAC